MTDCNTCGVNKANSEFHKNASSPSGLVYKCKACTRIKLRCHYIDNADKRKAYQAAQRRTNGETIKARKRTYYWINVQQERAKSRAWRDANLEQATANKATWRKQNKGKVNAAVARRRVIKKQGTAGKDPRITVLYELAAVLIERGYDVHVDHIVPLQPADPNSAVGLHTYANLQIISATENLRKGNRQETKQ